MIAFQCPHCFVDLKAKDELAGKKIKCRSCGEAVRVEANGDDAGDDEEYSAPAADRLPPRRKGGGKASAKSSRRGGSAAGGNPWLGLALKLVPFVVAAAILIGLYVASLSSNAIREGSMYVCLGVGALNWIVAYYWGLNIAIRFDPDAAVGYLIPRVGMRYISAYQEHMGGPFRLLLIGLAFMAAAAGFGWIDHKAAGY